MRMLTISLYTILLVSLVETDTSTNQHKIQDVENSPLSHSKDFIQIVDPPETIIGRSVRVTVEYNCVEDRFIGVEVTAFVNDILQKVFQKIWRCHGNSDASKIKNVKLRLKREVAFNYNIFNPAIDMTSREKLRAWILENEWWPNCIKHSNCFTRSIVKVSYDTQIAPPFSRPYYKVYEQCKTWGFDIITIATSVKIPTCPLEKETIEVIKYPVVFGGDGYGVFKQFEPYTNTDLETNRLNQVTRPKFTISIWLYVLEYCYGHFNYRGKLCSIVHRTSWNGEFRTCLILINAQGMLHIQVQHENNVHSAGLSSFTLPKHQWFRLVVQFRVTSWTATINYGDKYRESEVSEFTHVGERVFYNDATDLFVFGGSEYMPSFKGYIGQATVYRNRLIDSKQIAMPSMFHPMFLLEILRREEKCSNFMDWVNERILIHRRRHRQRQNQYTCRHPFLELLLSIRHKNHKPQGAGMMCSTSKTTYSRHRKMFDTIISNHVATGRPIDLTSIANQIYTNATEILESGIETIPKVFPILKQAACYGNPDAMYTISVILNNGIYVKADEIQGQAYLMMAAQHNHRLSALALGHKHRHGIEGVPLDWEISYRYHKFVADTTNADRETHKDTDVFTESIRLTDEVSISQQTDENGDIYHWLTYQAKQGVLSAQTQVARTLFWGQQGLKRNLAAAVEYFKMSADTGDAQSQYDYGIVLLRGQGVKKDRDAGLKQLQQAAKQKNPSAINAIGWHAMNYEGDMEKAVENFERAYRMGNVDAAYNLGVMYLQGLYPGKAKDADKALGYFRYAATRHQHEAGLALAYQTIKGTGRQRRDVYIAVEWARFIAEKNPAIGLLLRKALQAYRKGKHDVSLFYYTLVADTGHEVGSFNTAWLCEENKAGITSYIEKDCVWSRFNMSIQREPQFQDPYALIKMGDYYWYGCHGHKEEKKAAKYYVEAARKNDPHALFNLGFMIEEGVQMSPAVFDAINIPIKYRYNNITLLEYLYSRCKDSTRTEAYIPCSIALYRIQALHFWESYRTIIKLTGFSGVLAMTVLSTYVFLQSHLRGRNVDLTDNI